jgi:hypothetical protein
MDVALGVGTFTIAPIGDDFHFYQLGVQYRKYTSEDLELSDVEGVHLLYYDLGVLTEVVNPNDGVVDDIIRNKVVVAQIYWDTDSNNYIMF